MGFHYFEEKRKFDREWEQLEAEYLAAGMGESEIDLMRAFDWQWFCSRRVYENHIQNLPDEIINDELPRSTLFQKFSTLSVTFDLEDLGGRYGWLETISDKMLYQRLCALDSYDLELLTMIVIEGYSQSEAARIFGCSRNAVYKRMKKIKQILQNG